MEYYKSKSFQESIKGKKLHAVIFTGGEAASPEATEEYWNSPLCFERSEKPGLVIAADSGLETYKKYMFSLPEFFKDVPLLILGDFDSLSSPQLLEQYPEEIIEKFPCYKDYTDSELALRTLKEIIKDVKPEKSFITLVGGSGGRSDHFIGIFSLLGGNFAPEAWITENQVLYNLASPCTVNVKKLAVKDYVSVSCNFFDSKPEISSRNLEWENFMPYPMYSLSNRITEEAFSRNDPVEIKLTKGSCVLYLPCEVQVTLRKS